MERRRKIFVWLIFVIILGIVCLSMTPLSVGNAWAEERGSKVSPRGSSTDATHKSEIEIFQKQKMDPQPISAGLDCKWEQIKERGGIAWKCVGKDCEKCTKQVPSKAQSLKGRTCCTCEKTNSWYICRGDCCKDVLRAISPIQTPLK